MSRPNADSSYVDYLWYHYIIHNEFLHIYRFCKHKQKPVAEFLNCFELRVVDSDSELHFPDRKTVAV